MSLSTRGSAVQQESTATSPHSHQPRQSSTYSVSWDDSQTPSGAASSGRRGRRFKSGHPDRKTAGHGRPEICRLVSVFLDVRFWEPVGSGQTSRQGDRGLIGIRDPYGLCLREQAHSDSPAFYAIVFPMHRLEWWTIVVPKGRLGPVSTPSSYVMCPGMGRASGISGKPAR
jgi:hypothetical protein